MFVKRANLNPAFQHNEYVFRIELLKLFDLSFKVFDGNEILVFYSEQKTFKWKEDFRVYSDESKAIELLSLKTDQIFDAGAKYTIHDSTTNEVVGSIKRKMLKSILKSEWVFFHDGQEIGKFIESGTIGAIIRRLPFIDDIFSLLVLQSYIISDSYGEKIAEIKQQSLFEYKMSIIEGNPSIDRRLLISMGILLMGIEE